jgi:hypothetical protein
MIHLAARRGRYRRRPTSAKLSCIGAWNVRCDGWGSTCWKRVDGNRLQEEVLAGRCEAGIGERLTVRVREDSAYWLCASSGAVPRHIDGPAGARSVGSLSACARAARRSRGDFRCNAPAPRRVTRRTRTRRVVADRDYVPSRRHDWSARRSHSTTAAIITDGAGRRGAVGGSVNGCVNGCVNRSVNGSVNGSVNSATLCCRSVGAAVYNG